MYDWTGAFSSIQSKRLLLSGMTYFCKTKPSPIQRTLFLTFIILVLWVLLHSIKAAPEHSDTTLNRQLAALDGDGAPRDFISKVRSPTEETISTEKTKIPIEIPLRQKSGNDVALVAPKAREEDITWMPEFCKE